MDIPLDEHHMDHGTVRGHSATDNLAQGEGAVANLQGVLGQMRAYATEIQQIKRENPADDMGAERLCRAR
ncbi:hypothetical protein ACIHDR_38755 [Nocardia sp. NPDC052278]|uniref:hypothetical protein n=1 Tax=unclassified Nocardia TaxID=2637762 RepID=UPI0036AFA7A7